MVDMIVEMYSWGGGKSHMIWVGEVFANSLSRIWGPTVLLLMLQCYILYNINIKKFFKFALIARLYGFLKGQLFPRFVFYYVDWPATATYDSLGSKRFLCGRGA